MKKKMVTVILAGTLITSLLVSGCGKKTEEGEGAQNPLSVVTDKKDKDEETPDYLAPGVEFPKDAENMVSIIQSLMAAAYGNAKAEYYTVGVSSIDAQYFWESMQYAISLDYEAEASGTAKISTDDILDYATALFGNYDFETDGIPQIPDSCRYFVSFQGYNGAYSIQLISTDDLTPYITICEEDDEENSYKLQAELRNTQDDEVVGEYGFIFEENSDADDSEFVYKVTSCVNLGDDNAEETEDPDETEADQKEADDPDNQQQNSTDNQQNNNSTDTPDNTDAKPSDNNSSDSNSQSTTTISQSTAQSKAQGYMNERVSNDGSEYSLAYAGTKKIDGVDYYNYAVTRKDSSGNNTYVTNIYVDAASGTDVWDEAN